MNFIVNFSFPACLLAVLFTSGWAWAQAGDMLPKEPKNPFLQPYSPGNDYQILDASPKTNKHNTKILEKKSVKPKNIGKNPVIVTPTTNSIKSSLGQYEKWKIPRSSKKIGTMGSNPRSTGYDQSRISGSTSFLDGYLLRSLHDERIVRKKAVGDNTLNNNNNNSRKKGKGSFIK